MSEDVHNVNQFCMKDGWPETCGLGSEGGAQFSACRKEDSIRAERERERRAAGAVWGHIPAEEGQSSSDSFLNQGPPVVLSRNGTTCSAGSGWAAAGGHGRAREGPGLLRRGLQGHYLRGFLWHLFRIHEQI